MRASVFPELARRKARRHPKEPNAVGRPRTVGLLTGCWPRIRFAPFLAFDRASARTNLHECLENEQDDEARGREHPIRGLGIRRRLRGGRVATRRRACAESRSEGGSAFHAERAGGPWQGGARRVAALGSCRLGAGASPPRSR